MLDGGLYHQLKYLAEGQLGMQMDRDGVRWEFVELFAP